jgi:hypothetical protein
MKPDRSHNDWIVLSCVAVLAVLLIGIIGLSFADKTIGEEAYVVAGAIVGLIGGYVTAGRSSHHHPEVTNVESSVDVIEPTGAEPLPTSDAEASDPALVAEPVDTPLVASADESYGGSGSILEVVDDEAELEES